MDLNGLKAALEEHGQTHLVQFWEKLSDGERQALHKDLSSIDLKEVSTSVSLCVLCVPVCVCECMFAG